MSRLELALCSSLSACLFAMFCGCRMTDGGEQGGLKLAANGKTAYKIALGETNNPVDDFAAVELARHLREITGADFVIAKASETKDAPRIFLGMSSAAAEMLGDKNKLAELKDQECSVISKDSDLFLYGKGRYGNLYAVYEFLENQLGCRWYTAYGDELIPQRQNLEIEPVNHTTEPAFQVRALMTFFYDKNKRQEASIFHYRNRQNILLMESPGVEQIYRPILSCHTLSALIPPGAEYKFNRALEWLPNKHYFDTNPEFFSMDESGRRVPNNQVCFSNPALRAELTKNIAEHLRRDQLTPNNKGRAGFVGVECNDIAYNMCYCPECKKLQERYKSPGGPLFDYVIELCGYMKKHHPGVMVETLAYQASQTEIPPAIEKMPDNFLVIFAPINANFLAPLRHPSNAETLKNLKKWGQICKNTWVWYYPNTYNTDKDFLVSPPCGNLDRIAEDIKTMKEAGVTGTYFEHDSGIQHCANFTELQSWMMLKLFQNPCQDIKPLITEFTDFYYGKAAPAARKYLFELETLNQELIKQNDWWHYNKTDFPYLTPDNIRRWSALFDRMEAVTANDPERNFHVRLARLGLDSAAVKLMGRTDITSFNDCSKRLTKTFNELCEKRFPDYDKEKINKWLAEMGKRIPAKGIPEQFKSMEKAWVAIASPNYQQLNSKTVVNDSDASLGMAVFEDTDGKDFQLGFYDSFNKKYGSGRTIKKSDVAPDVYKLYKFNAPVKLSPGCMVWGGKWHLSIGLGHLCPPDDPQALKSEWDVYASLKFEGPSYSNKSTNKPNRVLCDRVILVKQEPSAAKSGAQR